MKKILIVDSNNETRNALAVNLSAYDGFKILSQESAAMAAKLVDIHLIDTLITEVDPPGMDGFKLISHVKKHSPDTRIVAIAELFTDQLLLGLKTLGVPHYLNKPVHMASLADFLLEGTSRNMQSMIHGVALTSFLQLMNIEKKTCTLGVSTDWNQGRIFIQKGEVIGAQTSELTGRQAFFRIMEWDTPVIRLTEGCQADRREISLPLMHLLMETHQRMDESTGKAVESILSGSGHEPSNFREPGTGGSHSSGVRAHKIINTRDGLCSPSMPDKGRPSGERTRKMISRGPLAERLQEMQAALFKITGPMARILFQDAVREWIKSWDPSESSLPALIEILTREINDPDKEQQYVKMISPPREKEPAQPQESVAWHMAEVKDLVSQVFKNKEGESD